MLTDFSTGGKFEGAYEPSADGLAVLFEESVELSTASQNQNSSSSARRRRRRAVTDLSFKGVSNPTVCLAHGSSVMWKVSNSDYPKYDRESLFNTNPSFDDGPFGELEERHQLESTRFELFAFRFHQEGVYVFYSSQNSENRMVSFIRVHRGVGGAIVRPKREGSVMSWSTELRLENCSQVASQNSLLYSTINSNTGIYCSIAFIGTVTPQYFIHKFGTASHKLRM